MIVAFSGIRDLSRSSHADVELAVADAMLGADEMRFGGARGTDTVALATACELADSELLLRVFVPGTLRQQPREAQKVAECADEIVELGLPLRAWAYHRRNEALLRGADRLVAFTDGRDHGGTAFTVKRAQELGIPIDVVIVHGERLEPNPRRILPAR